MAKPHAPATFTIGDTVYGVIFHRGVPQAPVKARVTAIKPTGRGLWYDLNPLDRTIPPFKARQSQVVSAPSA